MFIGFSRQICSCSNGGWESKYIKLWTRIKTLDLYTRPNTKTQNRRYSASYAIMLENILLYVGGPCWLRKRWYQKMWRLILSILINSFLIVLYICLLYWISIVHIHLGIFNLTNIYKNWRYIFHDQLQQKSLQSYFIYHTLEDTLDRYREQTRIKDINNPSCVRVSNIPNRPIISLTNSEVGLLETRTAADNKSEENNE